MVKAVVPEAVELGWCLYGWKKMNGESVEKEDNGINMNALRK